ncbi:MAG: hypothetical protein ACLRPR_01140 [Eisenbergiella sp.]
MEGNKELHDRRISEEVGAVIDRSDVVVLAQASMASAVRAEGDAAKKILTSPVLGIEKLGRDLGAE